MIAIYTLLSLLAVTMVWALVTDVRTRRRGARIRSTSAIWRSEREARRSTRAAVQIRSRSS